MDENTRQVLIALIAGLGGLITGIAVAWLGFRHSRKSDAARWMREDELRREDLGRERAGRWRDRKREVYTAYIANADRFMFLGGVPGGVSPDEAKELIIRMYDATAEMQLFAPDVYLRALTVNDATINAAMPSAGQDIQALRDVAQLAIASFAIDARDDLDKDGRERPTTENAPASGT